jgi:hypothetical protein
VENYSKVANHDLLQPGADETLNCFDGRSPNDPKWDPNDGTFQAMIVFNLGTRRPTKG